MKPERAKELLPVIQAYADGRAIQVRTVGNGPWVDVIYTDFSPSCEYRVKPELKLRPWKPEEVPIGCAIRRKDTPEEWCMATACVHGTVKMGIIGEYFDFSDCHIHCEHSTNNGKTWHPCGVMEEQ